MAVSAGASGGGSLRLMSCVRETSPADTTDAEETRNEPKKRRFHPLRGLRRMFRRKQRVTEVETMNVSDVQTLESRSQSASQLLEETGRHRNGSNLQSSGLSVSHDSIFSPEQQSADSGSELESTSSLSIQRLILAQSGIRAELVDAVRRRRPREGEQSDEEDLGLPRSPCSNSPTTADVLFEKVLKETTNKSSHSTCSDGSLLSMGSSEMDEDSYGQNSRHSSKLSLQDKRNLVISDVSPSHGSHTTHGITQLELGVGEVMTQPLSHSAARHKMAVRPKRTHGVPRRHRLQTIGGGSLPVTPEVNEDGSNSGRSVTPDIETNNTLVLNGRTDAADATIPASSCSSTSLPASTQLKSASLPPGMALQNVNDWNDGFHSVSACSSSTSVKLSRSRSSATNRQPLEPESEAVGETNDVLDLQPNKKDETSFFSRLLLRRSGKKQKKANDEKEINEPLDLPQKRMDDKGRYVHELSRLSRNHPAARQRVEPINISSADNPSVMSRMQVSYSAPAQPVSQEVRNVHTISSVLTGKDEQSVLKNPNHKVIPLNSDDLVNQRKLLLKKSNSFRTNHSSGDDNVLPFSSLAPLPSIIGLRANLSADNGDKEIIISADEKHQSSSEIVVENNILHRVNKNFEEINVKEKDNVDGSAFTSILNVNNESVVNDDNSIGVKNKNLVQEIKNEKLIKSEVMNASNVLTDKVNISGVYIKSSTSAASVRNNKNINDDLFVRRKSNINSPTMVIGEFKETSLRRSASNVTDSNLHPVSKPVGTSIVNITNDSMLVDKIISKSDNSIDSVNVTSNSAVDIFSKCTVNTKVSTIDSDTAGQNYNTSQSTMLSHNEIVKSHTVCDVKAPEPKARTQNLKDDSFVPVPAPRLSKRIDNMSLSQQSIPNSVPEFLKVQLNHVDHDRSQSKNVVLSKNLSSDEKMVTSDCTNLHEEVMSDSNNVECDMRSYEEVEVAQQQIVSPLSVNSSTVPVVTSITKKPIENVAKLNESKQKSCAQSESLSNVFEGNRKMNSQTELQQPVPNPRYSIVSITGGVNNNSVIPTTDSNTVKSEIQVVRKKSLVKNKSDLNSEVVKDNKGTAENSSLAKIENKTEQENMIYNFVLRKKSFNKDVKVNDSKTINNNTLDFIEVEPNNISSESNNVSTDNEPASKVILRQNATTNDVFMVETTQKKSSLDLSLQQIPNSVTNDNISDTKNYENSKEKYRNSFGSCDTLLSQDGMNITPNKSEVVYRRKSLTSREIIMKQKDSKDDEPELLKVFARRSLKIKDTDFNLSNNEYDTGNSENSIGNNTKSRDSDKENECGDSPPEERKKIIAKDNYISETSKNNSENNSCDNTITTNVINGGINKSLNYLRSQKGMSVHSDDVNNTNILSSNLKEKNQNSYEKRQRSCTFPDHGKLIDPPPPVAAVNQPLNNQLKKISITATIDNGKKEKEVELITKQQEALRPTENTPAEEGDVPSFKRIQQRKEEWEKRAQLAMKRTAP